MTRDHAEECALWALARRWDVASAYSGGVCTWDSRDRKDVTND